MATDLEQKPRPSAAAKYDTYVEEKLTKVRGRVRALDAGRITLLLIIVTLGYALGMAIVDRALQLPAAVRLGAFLTYLVVAGGLVAWILVCLSRRINPYYAAKKLEETLPDAKNSVVNWLDLRDEKLPPVIHSALGSRAAKDLKQADPERAVSAGSTWILAGIMAGLILGLLLLFVMGPAQFSSLLLRAFTPFRERGIDTRVSITMVDPAEGDATVPPNRAVRFRANIDGPVPAINHEKAPHIHYRFSSTDPFVPQPLETDGDGAWAWTMPADRVLNGGLWYKITAGDAETPEYQIRVVPNPQVVDIDVTYHYRKYLCKPDATVRYPKSVFRELRAPRGTEATLVIHANTPIKSGSLHLDWTGGKADDIQGELVADDPHALRFPKFLLDKGGSFTFNFTSGTEPNIDRDPYRIVVFEYGKPQVKIEKPEQTVDLPPNGTLVVEGRADSGHPEIGIQNMTLRMTAHVNDEDKAGIALEAKPYRPGKDFKLVNGKYPPVLKYMDFVALDQLKTDKGVRFPLAKDMHLEYWLEARDNTDYPEKNGVVGSSGKNRVNITDPDADKKKQEKERNQAKQEQKKHEEQQNQDLKKQNDEAQKENEKKQQDQEPQSKEEQDAKKKANDLKEKLNKEKQKEDNKGEAKGEKDQQDKGNKGESKPGSSDPKKNQQPDDAKAKENKQGPDNAGQKKEGPKEGQPDQAAKSKGAGKNDEGKKDQNTQAKDAGKKNPEAGPPGSAKDDKGNNSGNQKSAAKDQPEKQSGTAKDQGMNQGQDQQKSQAKGSDNMKVDPKEQASKKDAGKNEAGGQAKDSAAGKEKSAQKGDAKKGPKEDKSQAKDKKPGSETQVSEGKKGPTDIEKDGQGLTKGEDSVAEKSSTKGGTNGDKGPPPQAKTPGAGQAPQTAAKKSDPDQTKDAGQAKDEKGPRQQATKEQVEKWIKDLAKKDPKAAKKAVKDLKDALESRDPKIREAAQKALEENNQSPAQAKGAGKNGDKTPKAEPKDKGDGEGQGQAKQNDDTNAAGQGKDEKPNKDNAQAKAGDKTPDFGQKPNAMREDIHASKVDPNQAKRGGDLSLQDMKDLMKKMTPEMRKKANISDAEWQAFLKAAQEWERNQQSLASNDNSSKKKGTKNTLPTFNPFKLSPNQNPNADPLNTNQFQPPPEFRDAQREFTRPPETGKKK